MSITNTIQMPAISLHQPWASLIAYGVKTIETRSWRPPTKFIGQRIAIHGAKHKPSTEIALYEPLMGKWDLSEPVPPQGVIVATARLATVVQVKENREGVALYSPITVTGECPEKPYIPIDPYGNFSPGRWLWVLKDIRKITPSIKETGHQKFWQCTIPTQP